MNEKKYRFTSTALLAALILGSTAGSLTAQRTPVRTAVADAEMDRGVSSFRAAPRGRASVHQPLESSDPAHLIVESGPISFGEVVVDRNAELVDALTVRVFSDSDWELRLVPEAAIGVASRVENLSMSRLEWKSSSSLKWIAFRVGEPVVISRGRQTGLSGDLVSVDLRLQLSDRDPVGQYGFNLRLALETDR